jgi:DnaJ-class molecular chaperone
MTSQPTFNPYEVLGVEKSASETDIKEAYKSKIKSVHPDIGGNEEECKKLNLAKDLLLDPQKRSEYDTGGVKMGSGRPWDAFFSQFGGMGGIRFNMGGGAFSFHTQQVVRCDAPISVSQMIFGDPLYEFNSPLGGKLKLPLPPKTEPGTIFAVKIRKDERNDIIIHARMVLKLPDQLTEEQERILKSI